ncbi:MAG TPA: DUF2628 domain-containing protein [Acetobacteraceae bacterium]|nr:DUF2628 domain-containing protein [Acetobacteraceae bacterium]
MRVHTVHLRVGEEPVLVREGFAWGAFFLPTLWFLVNRLWLVAGLHLLAVIAMAALLPRSVGPWAAIAVQILVAMHARDLQRWTLARRGYALTGVVVAPDEDAAWARLATQRPDLFVTAWGQPLWR